MLFHQSSQPKPVVSPRVETAPSSKRPSTNDLKAYSVAPELPKYISLPAIKVDRARVINLGVRSNNQIATPNNIYDTGWYAGSAKPGYSGAVFVFGHVSSWQANGIFYNLKKLKSGDTISITRGDDRVFTYKVVRLKTYAVDKVDINEVLSPVNPAKPGLNLMTCSGAIIKGTNDFSERLVVFTEQTN